MATQIIRGNAMFEIPTESERRQAERETIAISKDIKEVDSCNMKIIKKWGEYKGDSKFGLINIDRLVKNPKCRQEYKVYFNQYYRAVRAERI